VHLDKLVEIKLEQLYGLCLLSRENSGIDFNGFGLLPVDGYLMTKA